MSRDGDARFALGMRDEVVGQDKLGAGNRRERHVHFAGFGDQPDMIAGAAIAILAIPLIQNVWSTTAVFAAIAVIVAIAAVAVTQVGPEARGLALDEVAPPTA